MKVKVAVSRCLLGERVRYDGTAKYSSEISAFVNSRYELIPFCPEVETGMGVPRPPIQLDMVNSQIRARRRDDMTQDYTDSLSAYARRFSELHPDLTALINKKGSPSCGYQTTKLHCDGLNIHENASGIFIAQLKALLPDLIIIDEQGFSDDMKRLAFIHQLTQKNPD
ncbi:MAG: DUF523 domain-containing protein [Gammaproteobacteria bacterium]|nr:DUF523 domain-containing protein [Gammaproteobacteria bacterium]